MTALANPRDLKQLPVRALLAYAARCARRVQPLYCINSDHPEAEACRGAIDFAIRLAEEFAAGNELDRQSMSQAEEGTVRALMVVSELETPDRMAAYAANCAYAVVAATTAAIEASRTIDPSAAAENVADSATIVTESAIAADPAVERAAQLDWEMLHRMQLGHFPELGEPIDATESGLLGPLVSAQFGGSADQQEAADEYEYEEGDYQDDAEYDYSEESLHAGLESDEELEQLQQEVEQLRDELQRLYDERGAYATGELSAASAEQMQQDAGDLEEQRHELQQLYEQLEAARNQLEAEHEQLNQEREHYEQQIRELRERQQQWEASGSDWETERTQWSDEREKWQAERKELRTQLEQLATHFQQLQQERESLKAEHKRLIEEHEETIQQFAELEGQHQELEQEREQLESELAEWDSVRQQLIEEREEFNQQQRKLQEEAAALREERERFAAQQEYSQLDEDELEEHRQQLEDERAELAAEREQIQGEWEELEKSQQKLEEERSSLEEALQRLDQDHEQTSQATADLDRRQAQLDQLQEGLEAQQQELQALQEQLQTEQEQVQAEQEQLQAEHERFQAEQERSQTEQEQYHPQQQQLEEERNRLAEERQALESERNALQQDREALTHKQVELDEASRRLQEEKEALQSASPNQAASETAQPVANVSALHVLVTQLQQEREQLRADRARLAQHFAVLRSKSESKGTANRKPATPNKPKFADQIDQRMTEADPLHLLLELGTAQPTHVVPLLRELSELYCKLGGPGVQFSVGDSRLMRPSRELKDAEVAPAEERCFVEVVAKPRQPGGKILSANDLAQWDRYTSCLFSTLKLNAELGECFGIAKPVPSRHDAYEVIRNLASQVTTIQANSSGASQSEESGGLSIDVINQQMWKLEELRKRLERDHGLGMDILSSESEETPEQLQPAESPAPVPQEASEGLMESDSNGDSSERKTLLGRWFRQ